MIRIEKALMKDLGQLANMEVTTQEFSLTLDGIKPYIDDIDKGAYIAKLSNRVVGHMLLQFHDSKYHVEEFRNEVQIVSIGVDINFRRVNISRKLIERAKAECRSSGINSLRIYVPHYLIDDKEDPWNVGTWMWKCGFKVVRVIDRCCFRYNTLYDLYVFEAVN